MTQERKNINYTDHLLAFVDVLGFTDMVKASEKDPAVREKVIGLLADLRDIAERRNKSFSKNNKKSRIKISTISDSIVVSSRSISEKIFRQMLWVLSEFYTKAIINHNVFIRGLITIGPYYDDDSIAFGPALINAYEMERSIIKWPRCVVDPNIFTNKTINTTNSWRKHFQYILIDNDGLPYLDYLGFVFSPYLSYEIIGSTNLIQSSNQKVKMEKLLPWLFQQHKKSILKTIKNPKEKGESFILSKYYPLAQYHNDSINRIISPSTQSVTDKVWNSIEQELIENGWNQKRREVLKKEFLLSMDTVRNQLKTEKINNDSVFKDLWNPK